MPHLIRLGLGAGAVVASVAVVSASAAGYQKTPSFAGYAFDASKITSVTARFTVPKVTCRAASSGIGPGLFIVTTHGQLTGVGVVVACVHAAPRYTLVSVVDSRQKASPLVVRSGDVLVAQLRLSTTLSVITVRDLRTNIVGRRAGPGGRSDYVSIGSAGILNAKNLRLGVDPFTTITFSTVLVQGRALGRWHPVAVERYRGPASRPIIQIRPGRIVRGGEAFTLNFVHS